MEKKKLIRLGAVLQNKRDSKNPDGCFIVLGESKNNDPKYNYSVEITVRDNEGKVKFRQTDGIIGLADPRANAKEGSRIPERLLFNLLGSEQE